MKIEIDGSTISFITHEIDKTRDLVEILNDFVRKCDDKRSIEYSSLISIICRQLDSINYELQSILAKAKENTTGSN